MTEEMKDETIPHDASITAASPMSRYARRYTPELAERILNEVLTGRALHRVCRDEGIPAYPTVYGWVLRDVEGFAARYARARDIGGRRGARAIQYSTELGERILREIESGRSLHDICRDDGMPNYSTALGWTARLREFAARYHRARAIGHPRHGGKVLYTDAIADRILAALASGRTLHDICLDDDMPSERTVYQWVSDDHAGFCARYYTARAAGRARMGRPTLYSPELADRILFELSEGRTVRDVCRADGMPASSTVRLWVLEDRGDFGARYRQARAFAQDDMRDEILEIVDDGRNDWMERRTRDGHTETVPYRENIQRSRLRYDARRWMASNQLPKRRDKQDTPNAKDDEALAWEVYIKLVEGKSRGLPSEDIPVDEAAWAAFETRFPGFPYGVGQRTA
jgi:transposase-like protein